MREQVLARTSLEQAPKPVDRWTVYGLQGWQRYERSGEGKPIALEGEQNVGVYSFTSPDGKAALPIFRVELPLGRYVGWLLARNANAIFQHDSARDFLLWSSNFYKLVLAAGNSLYESLVEKIKDGANILQDDPQYTKSHQFIGPPTGPVTVGLEVAKQRVKEFVTNREADRIGLVAFAGEALTQVPLTVDYPVVLPSSRSPACRWSTAASTTG